MWDLALMTIFINHKLYVGYSLSFPYGTEVLHYCMHKNTGAHNHTQKSETMMEFHSSALQ
jgi:hypothetical protein